MNRKKNAHTACMHRKEKLYVVLFYRNRKLSSVARAIEERPVSIPQAIHQTPLTFSDEQIGIVALIYGHEMPTMVRQFREKPISAAMIYLIPHMATATAVPANWPAVL
ncbi:MAG: hypothetical protein ACLVJ6_13190 [Merdibacter sp.]